MDEGTNRYNKPTSHPSRLVGAAGCAVALLLVLVVAWQFQTAKVNRAINQPQSAFQSESGSSRWRAEGAQRTAKEIVAGRISQFAKSRRQIVAALAVRAKIEVPKEVELFFDAVETGRWSDIGQTFDELSGQMHGNPQPHDLETVWSPVFETFGVVEETRRWPAEKLLDYGEAILSTVTPGMIYVGGSDAGLFVPTLLNATSQGEQHLIITQNALADRHYLNYIGYLYHERLVTPSEDERAAAFRDYLADAGKRLEHDEKFPDDPPQILPGEGVRFKNGEEGEVVMGGQVSFMAINERLLNRFMEQNPDATLALEESFPLKSTYGEASILGPILQLRAGQNGNKLTRDKAAKAVAYWRKTAEELEVDSEAMEPSPVIAVWSKMAAAQANLFAEHGLLKEAEQTYRLAQQIYSGCPEATYGLAQVLARNGRTNEAREIAEKFRKP